MTKDLKPALILGSGFHRHVFGDFNYTHTRQALWDWHALLDATAEQMQVPSPSRVQEPVIRWETLITRAQQEGFRGRNGAWIGPTELAAHRVEEKAKVFVADVLRNASTDYPASLRSQIPLDRDWGCVISLNFDHAWLPELKSNDTEFGNPDDSSGGLATKTAEFIRTQASLPPQVVERDGKANPRIWFPNGTVSCPKSIRMGLHDYGRSLTSIKKAFRKLKRWERGLLGPTKASSPAGFESIKAELRQSSELEHNLSRFLGEPEIPLTWIAEFMYRPLWFAGVGLSSQESGLWWLLAQRARNTARLSNLPENHTRILVHKKNQPEFWATRPFGIKAVTCDDWEAGWKLLLNE